VSVAYAYQENCPAFEAGAEPICAEETAGAEHQAATGATEASVGLEVVSRPTEFASLLGECRPLARHVFIQELFHRIGHELGAVGAFLGLRPIIFR
jgi:hypothetical protein